MARRYWSALLAFVVVGNTSAEFEIETAKITCTHDGFLPHPDNCRAFYWCSLRRSARAIILECDDNQIFDTATQNCLPPSQSTRRECGGIFGLTKMISDDRIAMEDHHVEDYQHINHFERQFQNDQCIQEGFMADEEDCTKFYRCIPTGRGIFQKYGFECGTGTVWDREINSCNHPWATRDARCGTQASDLSSNINNPPVDYYPSSNYEQQNGFNNVQPPYNNQQPPIPDYDNNYNNNPNNIEQPNYIDSNNPNNIQQPLQPIPEEVTGIQQPQNNYNNIDCTQDGFIGDVRDCQKFYRCVPNGMGGFLKYEFTCGQGTVWDNELGSCNHIWATRNSNCISNNNNNVPNSEYDPNNPNYYPENPENINNQPTYEITQRPFENNPYIPENQYPENNYEPSYEIQQRPENYPSSTETQQPIIPNQNSTENVPSTSETSDENPETKCTEESFIHNPKDCNKFFRCVKNGRGFSKYEFSCGDGTVWDRDLKTCNHPENTRKPCGTNTRPEIVEYLTTTSPEISSSINPENTATESTVSGSTFHEIFVSSTTISPEISFSTSSISENITSTSSDISSTTSVSDTSSTTPESTTEIVPQYDTCTTEGFIGDSKNCKKFYRCVTNNQKIFIKYEFSCGEGTIWDGEQNTCNYPQATRRQCSTTEEISSTESPENKDISSSTTTSIDNTSSTFISTSSGISSTAETTGTTISEVSTSSTPTPVSQPEINCTQEGFVPDTSDCKKFYRCVPSGTRFTTYQFTCGDGTVWDSNLETCNHISEVRNSNCESSTGNITESSTLLSSSTEEQSTVSTEGLTTVGSTELSTEEEKKIETTTNFEQISELNSTTIVPSPETSTETNTEAIYSTTSEDASTIPNSTQTNTENTTPLKEIERTTISSESTTSPIIQLNTSSTESIQSQTTSTTQQPIENNLLSSETCTQEGFFPNLQNCNKFYRCVSNGKGYTKYEFSCGPGTIWDPNLDTCNHPYKVTNKKCGQEPQSGTQTAESGTTESGNLENGTSSDRPETELNAEICTAEGFYPNRQDCKKFFRCVQNGNGYSKYEFTCGDGTIFDPDLQTCNHPYATQNRACGHSPDKETQTSSTISTTIDSATTEQEIQTTENVQQTTLPDTTTQQSLETTTQVIESTTELEKEIPTTQNIQQTTLTDSTTIAETTTEQEIGESTTIISEQQTTDGSTTTIDVTPETTTNNLSETTIDSQITDSTTEIEKEILTTQTIQQTTLTDSTIEPEITSTTLQSVESTTQVVERTTLDATTLTTEIVEVFTEQTTLDNKDITAESITETSTIIDNQQTTTMSQIISTTSSNINQSLPCPISELEGDQISLVCPTGFRRHPKYCNLFYQCTNNPDSTDIKILVLSCPTGTIFDDNKIQCLTADQSSQKCMGEIKETVQFKNIGLNNYIHRELNSQKPLCPKEGSFPLNQSKCLNNYIQCHLSPEKQTMRAYMQQCPTGKTYWPISKRCEKQSPILGCEDDPTDLSNWMIPVVVKSGPIKN